MLVFLVRRIGVMIVTALCLTFVVFYLTNLPAKLETLAKTQAGSRMTDVEVQRWIERNGYGAPMIVRYGEWLGVVPGWTREDENGVLTGRCIARADGDVTQAGARCGIFQGEWGFSTRFRDDVSAITLRGLGSTGLLMMWAACAKGRARTARCPRSPSPRPRRRNTCQGSC